MEIKPLPHGLVHPNMPKCRARQIPQHTVEVAPPGPCQKIHGILPEEAGCAVTQTLAGHGDRVP
eukprot:CAMPEP_0204324170 /NCGR_PEP_ID=MMETSP0469-20131031/10014_1 /ASSEMBLY_ACC=CAM_ASM_000384 /TAXON_ID=2969 /ORGANISM="Oxyrrhis marina" /LENGTH=63 /DNA_ID=CAMNT_0051305775 /DNA_START=120 /DNA_END=311 /DNA_ORIENTATION=+